MFEVKVQNTRLGRPGAFPLICCSNGVHSSRRAGVGPQVLGGPSVQVSGTSGTRQTGRLRAVTEAIVCVCDMYL